MSKSHFEDVAELLARVAADHVIPGVAVAAVVDGELAHVEVHGLRDVEKNEPVTPDTPSRWYSISKPLTAVAWGRLVEAGRVTWDQPLRTLLPDLRFGDPVATEHATIADCLLHRAGMIGGAWFWMGESLGADELMRRIPHVPCTPGYRSGFHYQNLNLTILGEAIKALGMDWHEAMREWLGLLGVHPLTRLEEFVAAERMVGYGPSGFMPAERMEDFDFEGAAGASAVCGSVKELAQVARMMVLGGTVDGRDVVSQSMWEELTRPILDTKDPSWPEMQHAAVSLAGRRVVYRDEPMLAWAGGFRGYTAHIAALPGRKAAGCAMVNRSASPASDLLALAMLDRAAGWDPLPWADRFLQNKKEARAKSEKKLAERLARPAGSWPCEIKAACGRFGHPAYGPLFVEETPEGARLRFRHVDLPLVPREDGTISADGVNIDVSEILWDLEPVLGSGGVTAWYFSPDDPSSPCRFDRV